MLAELAVTDPAAFSALVEVAKKALRRRDRAGRQPKRPDRTAARSRPRDRMRTAERR